MKILITGASGFIGSFIVDEAIARGWEVWAAVRPTSSRRYLQHPAINFIELNLGDAPTLAGQLRSHKQKHGAWDYIVHAAGVTKCKHRADFFATNTQGTQNLVEALGACQMLSRKLVYLSSLSVFGAVREKPVPEHTLGVADALTGIGSPLRQSIYNPILPADTPQPNTAYGESKLEAERIVLSHPEVPAVILRPTGVYGPREKDYFLMAKSIKSHIDFAVGLRRQEITFIYVRDVVQAVFSALERGKPGSSYFLTDGRVYSSRAFSDLLQANLGVRRVFHITAPLWLLRVVCAVAESLSRFTAGTPTLNGDKYNILKQRNWQCDISSARNELGFSPRYDLRRGVAEAVAWYRKEKWI